MKFIVVASSYNENRGGIIASHKLCHLLNEVGYEAYLYPLSRSSYTFLHRMFAKLTSKVDYLRIALGRGFRLNPAFNTELFPLTNLSIPEDAVVIYGDTVAGNPLDAKNVVRWFLHDPRYQTGLTEHGSNELHIDFCEFLSDYDPGSNFLNPRSLHVVHYPLDVYNDVDAKPTEERYSVAYMIGKGHYSEGIFDRNSATCVDGLSHLDCASVLRGAKRFYSFDPYTAHSSFAALCGAISIVIPPDGMAKSSWHQNDNSRLGIAFGLDDEAWAVNTMHKVRADLSARQANSRLEVLDFAQAVTSFFKFPLYSWSKYDDWGH